ncbi:hypothetical protein J578_3203, partial [Acinetobacter baumannii 1552865]
RLPIHAIAMQASLFSGLQFLIFDKNKVLIILND